MKILLINCIILQTRFQIEMADSAAKGEGYKCKYTNEQIATMIKYAHLIPNDLKFTFRETLGLYLLKKYGEADKRIDAILGWDHRQEIKLLKILMRC